MIQKLAHQKISNNATCCCSRRKSFLSLNDFSLMLIWISVPNNPQDEGDWLSINWNTVSLALNLLPFAGIAFLWFIGVVRDRLGQSEDRFFATVFLGSDFFSWR